MIAALLVLLPTFAFAHIEWFYPNDLSQEPRNVGGVLNEVFVGLHVLSIFCIYAFFLY